VTDAGNSPALGLGRCHVSMLVAASPVPNGLWVAVEGYYPTDAGPLRNMRDVQAALARACGVDRVRLRWSPSGDPDAKPEEYGAGSAAPVVLGAHAEAGDAFLIVVEAGYGPPVYVIADPRWAKNATAVWKLAGSATATARPPVAFVATAYVGDPLEIGTRGGDEIRPGELVAWCKVHPGDYPSYPDATAWRLALEHHRRANDNGKATT
jgi:hypothetical protein